MKNDLTDAELTILGLLAEQPRHGYDLENVIEARGIREWTALGFSSIYYLLAKLEGKGFVISSATKAVTTKRKTYALTNAGIAAAAHATQRTLAELRPMHPSVLIGMANVPLLLPTEVCAALRMRHQQLTDRLAKVKKNTKNNGHYRSSSQPFLITA